MELIVALIAGLAIFVLIVGLFGRSSPDPVQARLTSFTAGPPTTLEELEIQRPFFDRTFRPMAGRFASVAQRINSPARVSRTEHRLALAGYPGGMRTIDFLGLKLMLSVGAAIGSFLLFGILGRNLAFGIIFAIIFAALAYVGSEFWLSSQAKGRQKQILRALPDTLDLLTISVRAGLGFEGALAKVVEKVPGPLSAEFGRALAEIRIGRPRREALRDIVDRTEVPPLSAFIGAIIQAEQLGVPIAKVLQVQSEQLRIERRQRAEEMAARAPIKMLFRLVGCIFPSMFIVILGPAIILIIQNLSGPNAPGKPTP
jgi:tight adherence protein C